MPNNVTNQITFGPDDAARANFQRMLRAVRAEGEALGSIDFNKLDPMPDDLDIESGSRTEVGLKLYTEFEKESAAVIKAVMFAPKAECTMVIGEHLNKWRIVEQRDQETWNLGKKAFQNIKKYGHPTWCEWRRERWGTKWNADGYCPLDDKAHIMEFTTGGSGVPQLAQLLSKQYPEQRVSYSWANGNLGYNVGRLIFKNGKKIDHYVPTEGSRAAYEMAAKIIGIDLAECGFFLTRDRTSYEFRPRRSQGKAR